MGNFLTPAMRSSLSNAIYAPSVSGPGAQMPKKSGFGGAAGVNLQPFMGQVGPNGRYGPIELTPGQDGTWSIGGQGQLQWKDLVDGLPGVYGGGGGQRTDVIRDKNGRMSTGGGDPSGLTRSAEGQIPGGNGYYENAGDFKPGGGKWVPYSETTDPSTGKPYQPNPNGGNGYPGWEQATRDRGILGPGQVGPPGTFGGGIGGGPMPMPPMASPNSEGPGGVTGQGQGGGNPYGTLEGGTPLGDVGANKNYADQFQNPYQG
jgi:hypothetical protein